MLSSVSCRKNRFWMPRFLFSRTRIVVYFIKKKWECRMNGIHDTTMEKPIAQHTEKVVENKIH
jgi:hypothetical protein